jgi:hypothetical protein
MAAARMPRFTAIRRAAAPGPAGGPSGRPGLRERAREADHLVEELEQGGTSWCAGRRAHPSRPGVVSPVWTTARDGTAALACRGKEISW